MTAIIETDQIVQRQVAEWPHKSNLITRAQLTINTDIEAIVTTVKLTNNDINICNMYLPNHKPFTDTDINNIIKQLPQPFIIVGDFNSHNVI